MTDPIDFDSVVQRVNNKETVKLGFFLNYTKNENTTEVEKQVLLGMNELNSEYNLAIQSPLNISEPKITIGSDFVSVSWYISI